MPKLTEAEVRTALETLSGWSVMNGKLHREYRFPDFSHAFGFMAAAATAIEKMGHHPDWSNVYNRITIDLSTHDLQGITEKDTALAKVLEAFAQKFK